MKSCVNNCLISGFIVVALLCYTGVAQYSSQSHPGQIVKQIQNEDKHSTHDSSETVTATHAVINATTLSSTAENKQATPPLQLPPLKFPQINTTNPQIHFKENKTIENLLLNETARTYSPPPLLFPSENSTKYPIKKANETMIRKYLHECINNISQPNRPENSPPVVTTNEKIILIPPKVFPNDTKKFKIIQNRTKEDLLLHAALNSTTHPLDEVNDLLSKKQYHGEFDVDQIDPKFMTTQKSPVNHLNHNHLTNGRTQMAKGPLAGILIGILLLVTVIGYGALVIWRRTLELKYGNRERLVNEEDFDPHYDNRFEL